MRSRWCRRPETDRAGFGTCDRPLASLVSLSSSLSAGWPCTCASFRASSSRLLKIATLFRQDATVCWRRASDYRFLARTHSRRALGVWRKGQKSSNSDSFHGSSWESMLDGILYHSKLTTRCILRFIQKFAIQPSQEVAHTTSAELKKHDTDAFQNLRCNQFSQKRQNNEMRQLLHVPCNSRDHRTVRVTGNSLRTKEHDVYDPLHQHPAAPMKEENILGCPSVLEDNVVSASQEHEEAICSGHTQSRSKKRLPLSEKFDSDCLHMNDKTKPVQKSDANIGRMTQRQYQRKIVRQNQETPLRILTLCIPNGTEDGTCFNNYDVFLSSETTVGHQFSRRKIQKLQMTPPRSPRDSPVEQATSRLLQDLSTPKRRLERRS